MKTTPVKLSSLDLKDGVSVEGNIITVGREGKIFAYNVFTDSIASVSTGAGFCNSITSSGSEIFAGLQNGNILAFKYVINCDGIFDFVENQPSICLKGHHDNVSCLYFDAPDTLISGSWDGSLKFWDTNSHRLIKTIEIGHSVWVIHKQAALIHAGCADGIMRSYDQVSSASRIKLFYNSIRAISNVQDSLFVGENNGNILKMVNKCVEGHAFLGELLFTITSTDSFVCCAGEGGNVSIFDANLRLINHLDLPTQTIWKVGVLSDRIFCCGSDGILYILSDINMCEKVCIDAIDGTNGSQHIYNEDELRWEDGKLHVLREGQWIYLGEVSQDTTANEYDHNVDVELDNRMLKLRFNDDESAFDIASKFVQSQNLDGSFIPEIVSYLDNNYGHCIGLHRYSNININAISRMCEHIEGFKAVLNCLENCNKLSSAAAIKVLLKNVNEENFVILDCLRFLLSKKLMFDLSFIFVHDFSRNKKSSIAFIRLLANLCFFRPFSMNILRQRIDDIRASNSVSLLDLKNLDNNIKIVSKSKNIN